MGDVLITSKIGVLGPNGVVDSAEVLADQTITSSASNQSTTITGSGLVDEVWVIYPAGSPGTGDVYVDFGASPDASTTRKARAIAGTANVIRGVQSGDKVAIIDA